MICMIFEAEKWKSQQMVDYLIAFHWHATLASKIVVTKFGDKTAPDKLINPNLLYRAEARVVSPSSPPPFLNPRILI